MAGPRLLVPFNRTPAARRGLDVALRLAAADKGAIVHAVYVVEVERRLPLDAELPDVSDEGERCLAEAEEQARRYKAKAQGGILQARDAGHAIVDEAAELQIDTIVLGVRAASRDGQLVDLGRTADYVLRHAPCEVVVVRSAETE